MSPSTALESILIPPGTALTGKGQGAAIDVSAANGRNFLLTLTISEAVEQEYLELSVYGSADGTQFGTAPIVTLPQRFYVGDYPVLLDLSSRPDIGFVRVAWDCVRWGRGELNPRFVCGLTFCEVPAEILSEAAHVSR